MKKFDFYKTFQLILFVILAAASLCIILTDSVLYQLIANDPRIRALCILLWLSLVLSFLFTFIDFNFFSSLKRDYRELDFAVSSDPVSGIANRYSCDVRLEKYMGKPLPSQVGCITLDLSNLGEINRRYGHVEGNDLIRDFSGILQSSARDLCFVGRNGGNSFLALFEDCSQKKLHTFLDRLHNKVSRYNQTTKAHAIEYRFGTAFDEGSEIETINELVALSSRRLHPAGSGPTE